jgi:hypothetical protein
MTEDRIKVVPNRVSTWPKVAARRLGQSGGNRADIGDGKYRATGDELEGIDEGLKG